MDLRPNQQLLVQQSFELWEFFGHETRNKYEILNADQQLIGFAAEQQKGFRLPCPPSFRSLENL